MDKKSPPFQDSKQEYYLQSGPDFIKKDLDNTYTIEHFYIFEINLPFFKVSYENAEEFYQKYPRNRLIDTNSKKYLETRLEKLKVTLNKGTLSPFFSAGSFQGNLINMGTLLGKNVPLIFWATLCMPFMKEVP